MKYSIIIFLFFVVSTLFSCKDDGPTPIPDVKYSFELDTPVSAMTFNDYVVVVFKAHISGYHAVYITATPDPTTTGGPKRQFLKNSDGVYTARFEIKNEQLDEFDPNTVHFLILAQETETSDEVPIMRDLVDISKKEKDKVFFIFHPFYPEVNGAQGSYSIMNPTDHSVEVTLTADDGSELWKKNVTVPSGADLQNESITITGMGSLKKVSVTAEIESEQFSSSFTTKKNRFYNMGMLSTSLKDSVVLSPDMEEVSIGSLTIDAEGNSVAQKLTISIDASYFSDSTDAWDYLYRIGTKTNQNYVNKSTYWSSAGGKLLYKSITVDENVGTNYSKLPLVVSTKAFNTSDRVPVWFKIEDANGTSIETTKPFYLVFR